MEEEDKTPESPQEERNEDALGNKEQSGSNTSSRESRRQARKERRKGRKIGKSAIIVAVLIILAIVAFFIFRGQSPTIEIEPDDSTLIDETSPTASPIPTTEPIKRDEVTIQVLNGTGIAKGAGFFQSQLEDLGYDQIDVGNADNEDYVDTVVTFSSSLSEDVIDEITQELEALYEEVETDTKDSQGDYLVQIIIGYRKGYTPTPTESVTPTPTVAPEQDVTPTATPSATPAATHAP